MFEWIEINVVSSDDWFNCSNFCDDIESSISCNGFTPIEFIVLRRLFEILVDGNCCCSDGPVKVCALFELFSTLSLTFKCKL